MQELGEKVFPTVIQPVPVSDSNTVAKDAVQPHTRKISSINRRIKKSPK
jgi:hypothetical protein